ncbi:MAG: carboxypeptidase regulatory-like domain-containing protein, partial [Candidatus Aminicenantaceae bacterium]
MKSFGIKTAVFFLSVLILGAVETGEIKGRVTGPEGEAIPGVVIQAESPQLQGIRTTVTGEQGDFHLPLLPAGKYTLTVSLSGFPPVIEKDIEVRIGRVTEVQVYLDLTRIKEEITVTAQAPLIDKTSIDTSTYFNTEDLETVPVQERSVVDLVKYTPGVAGVRSNTRKGTSAIGQPSFRGEGAEGNSWILDGMRISGVRIRNSGVRLNYDSLKEVQILSDPFSPEYGSAYGGIINMVTKGGGNRFSGEFSLALTDKNLQASRMPQLSATRDPDSFSHSGWYFNLGGPIVRDRLWFFVSNDLFSDILETDDSRLDYLSIPGGRKSLLTNNIFAKLRWAIDPSHNLSLSSLYTASLYQKGGIGIPEVFDRKEFSDGMLRINYKGILNSTTYLEGGLGWLSRSQVQEPEDGDLGPAQYYIQDLARNLHNSYGRVVDDSLRLDINFKLKKVFETDTLGRHEMDIGWEYYDVFSRFQVDFTGQEEDIFPENGYDKGTKFYFSSWETGNRTPTFFYEYGVFDFINSSRGMGLFFEDKVSWNRVTVMAGFRSQTQSCLDDEGERLFKWGIRDFISPRLSFSWDITGTGRDVIKAGWGRYSDLLTTMPLGLLSSGAGVAFRTYRWTGPENPNVKQVHNPDFWDFENEQKAQDI